MSTSKPGQGIVRAGQAVGAGVAGSFSLGAVGAAVGAAAAAGGNTVEVPPRGEPVAIRLSKIDGLTKKGLLDQPFYFQCGPTDVFQRSGDAAWTDYATVGFGTASRAPSGPSLEQIQFSTLFVDYDPTWASYHYGTDPNRGARPLPSAPEIDVLGWVDDLRELRDAGTPVYLMVGQPALWGRWDIANLPVSIRSVADENRGGEIDARYITISLAQYRTSRASRRQESKTPETITVDDQGSVTWNDANGAHKLSGATLHDVAKEFYGSPGLWHLIAKSDRNPHLRSWTGGRDLGAFAKRYGSGQSGAPKGRRYSKIYVPKRPTKAEDALKLDGYTTVEVVGP